MYVHTGNDHHSLTPLPNLLYRETCMYKCLCLYVHSTYIRTYVNMYNNKFPVCICNDYQSLNPLLSLFCCKICTCSYASVCIIHMLVRMYVCTGIKFTVCIYYVHTSFTMYECRNRISFSNQLSVHCN